MYARCTVCIAVWSISRMHSKEQLTEQSSVVCPQLVRGGGQNTHTFLRTPTLPAACAALLSSFPQCIMLILFAFFPI